MDRIKFRLILWRLRRKARALSAPTLIAATLIGFDAVLYSIVLVPALARNDVLAQDIARLRARDAQTASRKVQVDPERELAAFHGMLARPDAIPQMLDRLHRAAESQGLALQQSEYQPITDPASKLMRYQIVLPLRGKYPEMRRFLSQATQELPGLTLDAVSFQRPTVDVDVMEVQVRMTLFVGGAG